MAAVGGTSLLLILSQFLSLFFETVESKSLRFSGSTLHPVILVPGDGGSQFQARLNKTKSPHIYCEKKTDYWFDLWLNIELLAPYVLDCTVDNLRLVYNNKTHTTSNSPGVEIRIPGFGNTSTVEYLDPSQFSATAYFHKFVEALVQLGYTRNLNVRGAPYDFRKAPNEMGDYIKSLVALVEDTYTKNNETRVILLAHSMGNPYTLYMLNRQSQAWKDKYIHSFMAVSGPWGGAAKTLKIMASGDNLGVFVVNPLTARPEQRSMPSTAWLIPYDTFWDPNEVMVYAPEFNYTLRDLKKFFTDINFMDGYYMRQDTYGLINKLTPPGVEVFCMHGVNVSTAEKFQYTKKKKVPTATLR